MSKKTLTAFVIALLASLLALATRDSTLIKRMEYPSWDMRVRALAKPSDVTSRIKLILLDQDSLDWGKASMGLSWPWPREVYAPIIDFVRRGGAQAIAFDVLYLEPSSYGVHDDQTFGNTIAAKPDVVGAVFLGNKTGTFEEWPYDSPLVPGVADDAGLVPPGLQYARMSGPIPDVATNVAMLANVHGEPDEDGVFRRAQLVNYLGTQPVMSLSAAMFALNQGDALAETSFALDKAGVVTGFADVPVDEDYRTVLRYRGPSQTHRAYNAAAIINSELTLREGASPDIDPEDFRDAYVLFGYSAPGLMDLRPSPVGKVYPGVEVHATALDNLLSGDFIQEARSLTLAIVAFLSCFVVALVVLVSRRAWQSVMVFLVSLPVPAAIGFAAYVGYQGQGVWWPVVPHTLAVVITLVASIVVNYATEGRQKAFIKQAFKHYLSPDVIEKIIDDPSCLELGGERRELTIFFSDLQGFSSISERLDPVPLTSLLNDYLTEMTDIIHEEGGTLDKYEGDAIIAFWNAPLDQEDHAQRGCRSAVRCQRRLAELRPRYREEYGAEMYMRIGVNTGPVVVGNMGSRDRFDYTVLGDAANLAARLEGANKVYGSWTMVSEQSWEKAQPDVAGRLLGALRVVGRSTPVNVYELSDTEQRRSTDEAFARGIAALQSGDVETALTHFATCSGDAPAEAYALRCREVIDQGADWDGIWNLTEK